MSVPPLEAPILTSGLLSVDEELIAAAIFEMRNDYMTPAGSLQVRENDVATGRRSFILLILLEMILPGLHADTVLTLLQQLVVSTSVKHLHKISDES